MADLLNEEHRVRLRLHWANLVALLNVEHGLLAKLYEEQVISESEMRNISALRHQPTTQNESLLALLRQKTRDQFDLFTAALKTTNQLELHRLLTLGGDIIQIHVTGLSPKDEKNFLITLGHPNNTINQQNLDELDSVIRFFEQLRVKFAEQAQSIDFYSYSESIDLLNDLCRRFWSDAFQQQMNSVIGKALGKTVTVQVQLVVSESFRGGKEDVDMSKNYWDRRISGRADHLGAFMSPSKEFVNQLFVKDLLSYDELKTIERLVGQQERKGALVDLLATKINSEATFDRFVDALAATKQWFIVLLFDRTPDVIEEEDMETDDFPSGIGADPVTKQKSDWHITVLNRAAKTEPVADDRMQNKKNHKVGIPHPPNPGGIVNSGIKTEPITTNVIENRSKIDVLYFTEYSGNISGDELQAWWSHCGTRCSVGSSPKFHRWQTGRDPELMPFYLLALSSAMRKNQRSEVERLLFFFAPSDEHDFRTLMLGFSGFDVREIRALISRNIKQASEYFPGVAYFQAKYTDSLLPEIPTVLFLAFDSIGDPVGKFQHVISTYKKLELWTKSIPAKIVNQKSPYPGEILTDWIACVAGNFSEIAFFPSEKTAGISSNVFPMAVGLSDKKDKNCIETLWNTAKKSIVIEPPDVPFRGLLGFVQSAAKTRPFLSYAEYVRRCVADVVASSRRRLRYPYAAVAIVMEIGAELGLEEPDNVMKYCHQGMVWRAYRVGDGNGSDSVADSGRVFGIVYIYV